MFQRIPKVQMTREVMGQILEAIKQGRIARGDCLPSEKSLMDAFGVGRSTVREALGALEALGIVRAERGRGHVVVDLGPEDALNEEVLSLVLMTDQFHQIHEVRMTLETSVAALTAARLTDDGVRELETILEDAAHALGNHQTFLDLTWAFHRKLAELSGNEVMAKLIGIINQMIRLSEAKLYIPFVDPQSELDLHKKLLAAVSTRDPERAREAMADHIEQVDRVVREAARKLQEIAKHPNPGRPRVIRDRRPSQGREGMGDGRRLRS